MKKHGFTLAEILISLSVIGIIAAVVIPSLMYNINSKVWTAKRAAIYSRMALAISSMDKIGGYGGYVVQNNNATTDTGSETFVTDGLAKVYKIKRICSPDDFTKCGPKHKITIGNGDTNIAFPANLGAFGLTTESKIYTRPTTFETANGELVLAYYNKDCVAPREDAASISPVDSMCVNFMYDINGSKAPNKVGEDIGFITVFQGRESLPEVVAPNAMPPSVYGTTVRRGKYSQALEGCEALGSEYTLPNMWELASLMLNRGYVANSTVLPVARNSYIWSSSVYSAGTAGSAWAYYSAEDTKYQLVKPLAKGTENMPYYCIYKTGE